MASDATFVEVGVRLGQRNQRSAENDCSADLFAETRVRDRDGCRRPDRRVVRRQSKAITATPTTIVAWQVLRAVVLPARVDRSDG